MAVLTVDWAVCEAPGGQIKVTATVDSVTGLISLIRASNASTVDGRLHVLDPQGRQHGGVLKAGQVLQVGPLPFAAVLNLRDPLNPGASIPVGWELGLGW